MYLKFSRMFLKSFKTQPENYLNCVSLFDQRHNRVEMRPSTYVFLSHCLVDHIDGNGCIDFHYVCLNSWYEKMLTNIMARLLTYLSLYLLETKEASTE